MSSIFLKIYVDEDDGYFCTLCEKILTDGLHVHAYHHGLMHFDCLMAELGKFVVENFPAKCTS